MSDAAIAQSLAPFESASELREAHVRLLEMLDGQLGEDASSAGETTALARLESEIRRFLERGAATGVYLEETRERTACQILLDYWLSNLAQAGFPRGSARLARFDGEQLPDLKEVRCPYVGLEAFRAQDQTYFFGREPDTKALLTQVRDAPLTVVLGASGSGKSSLVMGGVLPALAVEAPELRIVPPFVPGDAALDRLAEAVRQVYGDTGGVMPEAAAIREDPQRLLALLGGEEASPALITIDQFEEVFTLSSIEDREALAASLAQLLKAGRGHRVLLTMREEFRSRIVELRALSPYLDKAWCSMRPMDYDELRAAVEKPAALVNLQFQAGIVDDLVKKVLGQLAALPLLQFTLRLLWEKRDRNRITWEVYRKTGDPLHALRASADQFYDGLATQTQDEVKRVLLELVRVDELLEAYRQPVPRSRLLQAGRANTEEVLELLARNDYVRLSAGAGATDPIVEVKHESLVRNWPHLVGWIEEKRVEQRQRLALSQAARRWAESGRPPAGLLTGWQLEEAKGHADLSALEEEFVQTSAAALEHTQREREKALRRDAEQAKALVEAKRKLLRRTSAALIVILVAAVAIAGAAYHFLKKAQDLERKDSDLKVMAERLDKKQRVTQQAFDELQAKYRELSFAKRVQEATTESPRLSRQWVTISLRISTEEQRPRAKEIASQLEQNDIVVAGIQRVSGVTSSNVRYFRTEDESEAREIVRLLREYLAVRAPIKPQLIQGFEHIVQGKQYQIWFAPDALDSPQDKIAQPVPSSNDPGPPSRSQQNLQPELDRVTEERNGLRTEVDSWKTRAIEAERRLDTPQRLADPPSLVVLKGFSVTVDLKGFSVKHLSLGPTAGSIAIGTDNINIKKNRTEAWFYVWTSDLPEEFESDNGKAHQKIPSTPACAESVNGPSCYAVRRSDLALNKQPSGEFVVGGIRYGIRATRWDKSSGGKPRLSLVVYAMASQ